MRINPIEHQRHPWVVHDLLADFKIEDVWKLPVTLNSAHNLRQIQDQFAKSNNNMQMNGLSKWLFRFRVFLGRLFNWDEKIEQDHLVSGSIRERYAKANALTFEQLPNPGDGNFIPVYNLSEESLAEIENATVHAAIHLGKVPWGDNQFTVQMTIYVKPKGIFGRLYMLLIGPFRLLIVYPALLKVVKREWELYLQNEEKVASADRMKHA